jgi:hypothetical protein
MPISSVKAKGGYEEVAWFEVYLIMQLVKSLAPYLNLL